MVITAGVAFHAKIATGLGVTNASIGYMNSNSHGKTNKQAKYKPTRFPLIVARNAGNNNTGSLIKYACPDGKLREYWQGTDGLCGFDIPTVTLAIQTQDADGEWAYLAPRGGEAESYRAGDWIGHDTNATWDWGLPATGTKVVLGSSFTVAFNMLLPNESSLSYGDIFKPDNAEDTTGIYVNFYRAGASGNDGHKVKAEIDWTTGKAMVTLTAAQVSGIGLTVGGTMFVHFYGMTGNRFVSLRNSAQTSTLRAITVFSAEAYTLAFRGEVLKVQSTGAFYLYNLTTQVNATYYAGGTLASGSVVKLFREVTGTSYSQYNSLYTPIWQSGSLGAVTVASGETKNALTTSTYTSLGYIDGTMTGVVMIWYAANGNVLASYRVTVRTVTSI